MYFILVLYVQYYLEELHTRYADIVYKMRLGHYSLLVDAYDFGYDFSDFGGGIHQLSIIRFIAGIPLV